MVEGSAAPASDQPSPEPDPAANQRPPIRIPPSPTRSIPLRESAIRPKRPLTSPLNLTRTSESQNTEITIPSVIARPSLSIPPLKQPTIKPSGVPPAPRRRPRGGPAPTFVVGDPIGSLQDFNQSIGLDRPPEPVAPPEPLISREAVVPIDQRPSSPRDRTMITLHGIPLDPSMLEPIEIITTDPATSTSPVNPSTFTPVSTDTTEIDLLRFDSAPPEEPLVFAALPTTQINVPKNQKLPRLPLINQTLNQPDAIISPAPPVASLELTRPSTSRIPSGRGRKALPPIEQPLLDMPPGATSPPSRYVPPVQSNQFPTSPSIYTIPASIPPTPSSIPPAVTNSIPPAVTNSIPPAVSRSIPPAASQAIPPAVSQTIPPAASRSIPPAVSHSIPPAASRSIPPAASRSIPPAASHSIPPAASHSIPPAASHSIPPAVSRSIPPAASHSIPPAASHSIPPAASQTIPPAASQTIPPAASHSIPPAASQAIPLATSYSGASPKSSGRMEIADTDPVPTGMPVVPMAQVPPLNLPDYASMSPQEQAQHRATFRTRFGILRNAWPSYNIPDLPETTSLEEIHAQYDIYVRHIHISQEVDKYKIYIVIMFLLIELFLTKIGLNIGGYTVAQMRSMNKYERLLIELGETNYRSAGVAGAEGGAQSQWPVEFRLFFMALVNAVTFIVIKMLANYIGEGMANTVVDALSSYLSGAPPQPGQVLFGSSTNAGPVAATSTGVQPGGPPLPESNNPFGGLDIASLLANFGSMFINGQRPAPPGVPATIGAPAAPVRAPTSQGGAGTPRFLPAYNE